MSGERKPLKVTVIVEDPNHGEKGRVTTWEIPRAQEYEFEEVIEDTEIYSDFKPALLSARNETVSLGFRFLRPMRSEKSGELYRLTVTDMP